MIHGYAAHEPAGKLEPFEFDPGALAADEVEITVETCGICHSDLSMLDNEWGFTAYPIVAGHEVAGKVAAVGDSVTRVKVGDWVGTRAAAWPAPSAWAATTTCAPPT